MGIDLPDAYLTFECDFLVKFTVKKFYCTIALIPLNDFMIL